jgi:hypothetical protein
MTSCRDEISYLTSNETRRTVVVIIAYVIDNFFGVRMTTTIGMKTTMRMKTMVRVTTARE